MEKKSEYQALRPNYAMKISLLSEISKLDALMCAVCLETAIFQLRIVEGCFELHVPDSLNETGLQNVNKIHKEREIIKNIFGKTLVEMAASAEWSALRDAVNRLEKRASFAPVTRRQNETLKTNCKELQNKLKRNRHLWSIEISNKNQNIAELRDKLQDVILNGKFQLGFAEKWLCAREEMLVHRYEKPKERLPNVKQQERVHEEIIKFIELQIKEREDSLEYWRKKYADDIANMNERLVIKREELLKIIACREEMQKQYEEQEGEMRAWKNFKKARAERLALEAHLNKAASKIQSWWRGVMVCKAFGPFRYLKNAKKSSAKTKKK